MTQFKFFAGPALAAAVVLATSAVLFTGSVATGGAKPSSEGIPAVAIQPMVSHVVSYGQPFQFRVQASTSGYAHVYLLTASGSSHALAENLPIKAERPVSFPSADFSLRGGGPAGKDRILVLATRERIKGLSHNNRPVKLNLSHTQVRAAIDRQVKNIPRQHWAFAETFIRVVRG